MTREPTRSRRRQGRRPEPRMRAARAPRLRRRGGPRRRQVAARGSRHSSKSRRMGTTDWTAGQGRSMCSKRPRNPLVGSSPVRSREANQSRQGTARASAQPPARTIRGHATRRVAHEAASAPTTMHAASSCPSRFVSIAPARNSDARQSCHVRRSTSQRAGQQRGQGKAVNPEGSRPAARVSARRSVGQRGRGAEPARAVPRARAARGARRRPRRSL